MDDIRSMRAALRIGRRQLALADLPAPTLEPGTAIVRVRAAGICGSDLHLYHGRDDADRLPMGHEVAGEVTALAPRPGEAPTVRVGDRVAVDTICYGRACGECEWCRAGLPFHCQQKRRGDDWGGAFAHYLKRDLRGLFPLPANVSDAEGALVEPLAVGVHALRQAGLAASEPVAIIGAGTIGLTALLAARALGAGPVYVLARHAHQAASAQALGAAGTAWGEPAAAVRALREQLGPGRAPLVLEAVGGQADSLNQAWALLRPRGRVAVLGVFTGRVPVDLEQPLGLEAQVLFPVCYGSQDGRADFAVAIDLIASGAAPVAKLLTHRFPLEAAPAAFSTAADKATGAIKVQLEP